MRRSAPATCADSVRDKDIGSKSVKNHIRVVKDPIASCDGTIQVSTNKGVTFQEGKWDNEAETNANVKTRQRHQTNIGWQRPSISICSSTTERACTPLTKSFDGTKHLGRG